MATLNFKGKSFVQNHHLAVPYHELVPKKDKSLTDKVRLDDNLLVHGDNLKALKALLPTYAGKVKCIYIDPPYNLGTENWVYNDNVNSPMIQEWLGKIVDREDLTRHEKWLCMMMPRLKLLREFMRKDGLIFVSIDDNELHRLRSLMDEIFGEENFVENIIWKKRYGGGAKEKHLVSVHEYVLCYARSIEEVDALFVPQKQESIERYYKLKDKHFERLGAYRTHPLEATKSMDDRKNLVFPIKAPDGKKIMPKRQWLWSKERVAVAIGKDELAFLKDRNGNWSVHTKQYLKDEDGNIRRSKAFSIIDDVYSQHGTNEVIDIFGDAHAFPFPKPTGLLKTLLNLGTRTGDIILDSFAGSGATAHATLALNKADGGKRKFISIECENYADKVTAERIRRVIRGIPKSQDESLKKGLGGSFSYFELGKRIDLDGILDGKSLPSFLELARYVFYTATGQEFEEKKINEKKFFIGSTKVHDVYLFYKPDVEFLRGTALTLERARAFEAKSEKRRLVFAPTKYLDEDQLAEFRIDFAQLPFEIYRLAE